LNAGMDDHLAKPLSRQQLQVKIDLWMPEIVSVPVNTEKVVAESSAKDVDVLDRQVLAQLRELENADDPNLLSRVLQLYLNESPRLFSQLKQAVLQSDAREIELSAHALKSSSANVGATALAGLCVEIHSAVRLQDFNRVRQIFAEAEIAFTYVQAALTAEINQLAAQPAMMSVSASSGWKT
jgi:two-component system, sensor histidine kinase and response regulator